MVSARVTAALLAASLGAVPSPAIPEEGQPRPEPLVTAADPLLASADPRTASALPTVDAALGALPTPPETVILQTRYFGTVTVTHRNHLERRISCKSCHGPGRVGKIEDLSAERAHGICQACHLERKAGPVGCRDCHVGVDAKPSTATAELSQPAAPAAAEKPPAAAEKAPAAVAAAMPPPTPAEMLPSHAVGAPGPREPLNLKPLNLEISAAIMSTRAFDGHIRPGQVIEGSLLWRARGRYNAGVVLGDLMSTGGTSFFMGARGGWAARNAQEFTFGGSADLGFQVMRASLADNGLPVSNGASAALPYASARFGVTWHEAPGGWLHLSAVVHTSMLTTSRSFTASKCQAFPCQEDFRFGGASYGLMVGFGTDLRRRRSPASEE